MKAVDVVSGTSDSTVGSILDVTPNKRLFSLCQPPLRPIHPALLWLAETIESSRSFVFLTTNLDNARRAVSTGPSIGRIPRASLHELHEPIPQHNMISVSPYQRVPPALCSQKSFTKTRRFSSFIKKRS